MVKVPLALCLRKMRCMAPWESRAICYDDVLINRAKQVAVTVQEGCTVRAISRETARWAIHCRSAPGEETWRARFLVGADGRNSKVARELKLDGAAPRAP